MRRHKVEMALLLLLIMLTLIACDELLSLNDDTVPSTPALVYPQVGAVVGVENLTLDWVCTDEDGDQLVYTLYFGTTSEPDLFASNIMVSRYTLQDLAEEQTYYWFVHVEDEDDNVMESPVWSFETEGPANHVPMDPYSPTPADNQTGVSIETSFSWQCDDEDGDDLTYSISIDEGNDGSIDYEETELTNTTYAPSTKLLYGTEYAWTVTATDPLGGTSSSSWSFTTEVYQAGQMVSTVSNIASYGDPNSGETGNPSGEWPAGSSMLYIWDGGFWAGAIVGDRSDTLTTRARYGNYDWLASPDTPGDPTPATELVVLGNGTWEYTTSFEDTVLLAWHHPIGLLVDQKITAFPADGPMGSMFLVEQTIRSSGRYDMVNDLYLAMAFDCDVASGPNESSANIDDLYGYDAENEIVYMYDGDNPDTGEDDTEQVPGYVGIAFVGGLVHPAAAQYWDWEDDLEEHGMAYRFMSGQSPFSDGPFPAPPETPYDYRMMLSCGPYQMQPGDEINLAWVYGVGDGFVGLQTSVAAMREWYSQNR